MILHARVADGRAVDEADDLPCSRLAAYTFGANGYSALAEHRRGEGRLAHAARDGQALARNRLLVDQCFTLGDLSVDRDHLAGKNHNLIADLNLFRRNGDDASVPDDPCSSVPEFEKIADSSPRTCRGQVAYPVTELDQPCNQGAGNVVPLNERCTYRERVEEVDVEAAFLAPDAVSARRDRIGIPEHQGDIDGAKPRVCGKSNRQRDGWKRERIARRSDCLLGNKFFRFVPTHVLRAHVDHGGKIVERHQP